MRPAPVLALLDFPRVSDREQALSLGAAAVVSKPVAVGDLLWELERMQQGERKEQGQGERNPTRRAAESEPPLTIHRLVSRYRPFSNFPNTIRPALVCSTLVTATETVWLMRSRPDSMTTIVPSSRYPTPWPGSSPALTMRTSMCSPGRKTGFSAVGQVVEVDHGDALQPGDLVEVVVVGDQLALQMLGQRDQLQIDRQAGELGQIALVDHQLDVGVVAEPVEDVQPAPAAAAAQPVGAVGHGLQFADDELGHDQLPVENVRLHHVGDPPVDHHAGVEDARLQPLDFLGELDVGNDEAEVVLGLHQQADADVADAPSPSPTARDRGTCRCIGSGVRARPRT